MALYRPTNIIPSSFSGLGNGAVDITKALTVSWQVDGSSAMTAYQIVIQENTTESKNVYDSGKVMLDKPFFGTDYMGNQQRFSTEIPAEDLSEMTNGYENGYKLLITEWWSETEFVEQVQPAFFVTRTEPVLTMEAIPSPMNLRKYTFSAGYTQEQGDTLNWFRWMVAENEHLEDPLEDTGNIYGTEDIRFSYDGFFTGNTYAVRCICETENGMKADTGWKAFQVQYNLSTMSGLLRVCRTPVQDALLLSWAAIRFITGTADGPYMILDGQLYLPEGSSVAWDQVNGSPMRYEPQWCVAWKGSFLQLPCSFLTIYGQSTKLSFESSNAGFSIKQGDTEVFSLPTVLYDGDVWTIVLTPGGIWFRLDYRINGLYPSENLYSSENLYPNPGEPEVFHHEGVVNFDQFAITGFSLAGNQNCQYLWAESGAFADKLDRLMQDGDYRPEYGDDTLFLTDFNNELNAGNLQSTSEAIVSVGIYRQRVGSARLTHLLDLPLLQTQFLDYGFRNQKDYQYHLFPQGENTFVSEPLSSSIIRANFWNWTLLVCREDEDGIFHVEAQYAFRNNVETGSVSNNSEPGILKNFTPYPIYQHDSANYRTGTLTALIGRVDQNENQYIDTTELADEIYALSVDDRPKFLKDRKGNLIRVELAGAIIMTVGDAQAPQPYTVQLPWGECMECGEISIVRTPDDGIPDFSGENSETTKPDFTYEFDADTAELIMVGDFDGVAQPALDVNPATGELIMTTENGGLSPALSVNDNGYLEDEI